MPDYMSNFEFYAQEMEKIRMTHDPSFKNKLESYRQILKLQA